MATPLIHQKTKAVMRMIGQGFCIKEIASVVGTTIKGVEYHWARCKEIYGFKSYVDAAHFCLSRGLIRNEFAPGDAEREAINEI